MSSWIYLLKETFHRSASTGRFSPEFFGWRLPPIEPLQGKTGNLHIELASHCWQYSHLLRFQLSSILLCPPEKTRLTVSVLYCPEDKQTIDLLNFYSAKEVKNVTWNFVPLERTRLFRRAIGRNLIAKNTKADWIFFSDCDQMFYHNSIDQLAETLQGRSEPLLFPRHVQCSIRVHSPEEVVRKDVSSASDWVVEVDSTLFHPVVQEKAIGGTQIFHGDLARQVGYCEAIPFYQQPIEKLISTYEDRAFRWLLGTHGVAIEVPHIYRIEHFNKGRYNARRVPKWLWPFFNKYSRKDLMIKLFKSPTASSNETNIDASDDVPHRRAA